MESYNAAIFGTFGIQLSAETGETPFRTGQTWTLRCAETLIQLRRQTEATTRRFVYPAVGFFQFNAEPGIES